MNRNPRSNQYYLDRGYVFSEAVKLAETFDGTNKVDDHIQRIVGYDRWKQVRYTNCSLKKENQIKKYGLSEYEKRKASFAKALDHTRENSINTWVNRGYSIHEAKAIVSKIQRTRSKRCVEYWTIKGYTINEAVLMVSESQSITSKKSFLTRYGDEVGSIKYVNYIKKLKEVSQFGISYWLNKHDGNSDKAIESLFQYQSKNGFSQRGSKKYWLSLGYDDESAEQASLHFSRKRSSWCYEYWLDKGFLYNEAIDIVKNIQSKNARLRKFLNFSKLEKEVISELREMHPTLTFLENEIVIDNGARIFPDIVIKELNTVIEVYGDFWHANPRQYKTDQYMHSGMLAKEIWEKDKVRLDLLKKSYDNIIVLWESDIKKNGIANVKIN